MCLAERDRRQNRCSHASGWVRRSPERKKKKRKNMPEPAVHRLRADDQGHSDVRMNRSCDTACVAAASLQTMFSCISTSNWFPTHVERPSLPSRWGGDGVSQENRPKPLVKVFPQASAPQISSSSGYRWPVRKILGRPPTWDTRNKNGESWRESNLCFSIFCDYRKPICLSSKLPG